MVFGWGLTLISWKWFIFGTITQGILVSIMQYINKNLKDK